MVLGRYICLFMLYSFMGWIYECFFCVVKTGKWDKRSFLYGPVCPIYGTGALIMTLITDYSGANRIELTFLGIFLFSAIGSVFLEYGTSWVLEKIFHAVWWDYSDYPLNLHGRVCLFSSFGFGVAGLFTVKFVVPFAENLVYPMNSLLLEILSLIFICIFTADLTLTVTALKNFDRVVINFEDSFNKNMESLVSGTIQRSEAIKNNIISGQKVINSRIALMSELGKGAVRRISSFRYSGSSHNTDKAQNANIILRILKRR
ncbi:MAG: putative ABC transporter permease [Lachnospiraceae bacterium]|nr:putative ABC transporter permease [Lachnospiraceae bacterium]